jgi:hypothetical protein
MPFALVAVGLTLIVTGARNTYAQLGAQLAADGSAFLKWIVAIGAVGALGYIQELRQFSHWFMALILLSMILSNRGVFAQFTAALNAGPKVPNAAPTTPAVSGNTPGTSVPQNPAYGTYNSVDPTGKMTGWFNYFFGTPNQGAGQ